MPPDESTQNLYSCQRNKPEFGQDYESSPNLQETERTVKFTECTIILQSAKLWLRKIPQVSDSPSVVPHQPHLHRLGTTRNASSQAPSGPAKLETLDERFSVCILLSSTGDSDAGWCVRTPAIGQRSGVLHWRCKKKEGWKRHCRWKDIYRFLTMSNTNS